MPNENSGTNTQKLQALFEAFNRHDIDAVMSFFADDCVFHGAAGSEAYGTRFEGADAISTAFSQVWAKLPDVQWRNTRHFSSGDFGLSEWLFTGTQPDGKRIEAQGCDLFKFRNGKIVSKDAYRKDRPLLDPK